MPIAPLYCRISSASVANQVRKPKEILWASSRGFEGIRVNIALTGGAFDDPANPDFTYLNEVLDLVIPLKLKIILGLGGEGPPKTSSYWQAIAGGTWTDNKRPPIGTANAMCIATASIKSQCIALVFERYRAAGLDPLNHIRLELGNEPGRGGAGAPTTSSGYWGSMPVGYWDSSAHDPAPGGGWVYDTFLEYFNIEYFLISYLGLPLISPTFTARSIDLSTNGLQDEVWTFIAAQTDWFDDFILDPRNCFGLNCYYSANIFNLGLGGSHYANWAVDGRDNARKLTRDVNAFWHHIVEVDSATGTSGRIVACETGINPEMAGMVEDPTARSRQTNFSELGRMRLATLEKLRRDTPLQIVSYFAASDSDDSSEAENQFGAFSDELGTINDQTYSSEIPFAIRAGWIPSGPYAGDDYILGDNESLPPIS